MPLAHSPRALLLSRALTQPIDAPIRLVFDRPMDRAPKVVLFASFLPAGTYEYTYQTRAGLDGVYNVMPAYAEEMCFPEVFGRSDGSVFVVGE